MTTFATADPARPRGWPIVGQVPAFLSDKLGFLSDCAARYGDVVELHIGARTFLLNHPNDIGHVLVDNHTNYAKSDRLTSARGKRLVSAGLLSTSPQTHGPQRRILRPLFHRATIAGFAQTIARNTRTMVRRWREFEVDIEEEMATLARQNILAALFSVDACGPDAYLADAIAVRQQYLEHIFGSLLPLPEYQPAPVNLRYRRAIRQLDAYIYASIERRRSEPDPPDDLLSMLLAARYEDGSPLTDKEVREEALTFSLTGYETVGEALTWTLHLLSEHPRVREQLEQEIAVVLGTRPPEPGDLPRLPYLSAVLWESMRLYPPTWIIVRVAVEDDVLPSGAGINKGDKLYLCQWVTHRTERYFPNATRFDPDRFGNGPTLAHPKHAYFPFGLGPRRCIGENFALMEANLVLATMLQNATLTTAPGQTIVPQAGLILRPRYGLRMRVRRARKPPSA